jgi:hypothetical protein
MSKPRESSTEYKNKDNREWVRKPVLAIKLKRTDTTLDLSQKAKRAKEESRRTRASGFL